LACDQTSHQHDSYSSPNDLTLEIASEQGLQVDEAGFAALMDQQRQRAKADARAKKGGSASTEAYRELRTVGETRFTGYDRLRGESRVRGIIAGGSLADRPSRARPSRSCWRSRRSTPSPAVRTPTPV